ncbi:DUF58 domain-containing protein [Phycicoccus endophyticus]|uniref:DUF58 domain-containing protein n=1 Tax=Phycicoccus endophyticus TaxID=1690220 RepID=A0A7G9QZF7_9MICO|nr:DUF58 domain-containing protein [Phycicoccus endophyticus]NHI19092.1 DUF58 domain-containing protein [Phycicoccus endophyticus]QNN48732.1 DUF58 domain-containing protein [Phycicoccus endophyticus]GGL32746.1 hypothetical protein GCM10012283_13910 [Phycicoccus endophyticus]
MSPLRALTRSLRERSVVTGTGWGAALVGALAATVGWVLAWDEARIVGLGLLVLLGLAVLQALGGSRVDLELGVHPVRVRPGTSADGSLRATNARSRRVAPAELEVPVGERVEAFRLPSLGPGGRVDHAFTIPTTRRGVIVVGPVTTVLGDPFGLARRTLNASRTLELFVHPRVLALPSLDAGLVRDLEGRPTPDPSVSDLDFHTLRGYLPGDDRRHVHWRSSARVSAAAGSTALMMKTYTDTRRSHLAVLLDARPGSYPDEDAFETAVTAAASVAVRALRDEMDVTVVAGEHAVDRAGVARTLDGFARVEPYEADLPGLAARVAGLAPGTSIAVVVTGAETPVLEIQRVASHLGGHVRLHVLRVAPGQRSTTSAVLGMSFLTMGALEDLPRLVRVVGDL